MTKVSFRLYSRRPRRNWISVLGGYPFLEDLKEVTMENDTDSVGGYAVPVDPMDLLQCDSCQ